MAYPPGAGCNIGGNTASGTIIGPGVTAVTGLPPGLSFPGIFGADWITGTPTTPGYYVGTINGLDCTWIISSGALTPGWTPDESTTNNLTQGVTSTLALTPSGGTPPYSFGFTYSTLWVFCPPTGGPMPPGLTFHGDGTVTGTPTTPGFYAAAIYMLDANFRGQTGNLYILVAAGSGVLAVVCASPPAGTVGDAYSHTFPASGGTPPYGFAITAGALPGGLNLDAATGAVTGTPTLAGLFSFTVQVTDAVLATDHVDCSITVVDPAPPADLSITCGGPPAGTVDVAYTHAFPATDGLPAYSFALVGGGILPPGLTLDAATGTAAGLPYAAGTFAFTVQVTDLLLDSATVNCSITIAAPGFGLGNVQLPIGRTVGAPIPLPDPTKGPCT